MASQTRSPGTASQSGSTIVWNTPNNAFASDDVYTTCGSLGEPPNNVGNKLQVTNFGFNIPSGATIDGIVVEVEAKATNGGVGVNFNESRIVKGGTIAGTEQSVAGGMTGTDTYRTAGSSSNLWGETWTPADINSSGFGYNMNVVRTSGTPTVSVDHIRITVYYTEAEPVVGPFPTFLP